MSGHDAWWLKKNALQPTNGNVEDFRERGALSPCQLRARNRGRAQMTGQDIAPQMTGHEAVAFNVRFQRRNSHEAVMDGDMFANLGARKPPPTVVNAGAWRLGDDQPFSFDGRARDAPAPRPVNTSEWRSSEKHSMATILHGDAPTQRAPAPTDSHSYKSTWRKTDCQPLSIAPDHRRAADEPVATRDVRWRMGSDAPWQPDSGAPTRLASRRPSYEYDQEKGWQYDQELSKSNWRLGDDAPFRMDGAHADRAPPSAILASSDWRSANQPLTFGADAAIAAARLTDGPARDRSGERDGSHATRERRFSREQEQMAKRFESVQPIGDQVQRVRKGESYW